MHIEIHSSHCYLSNQPIYTMENTGNRMFYKNFCAQECWEYVIIIYENVPEYYTDYFFCWTAECVSGIATTHIMRQLIWCDSLYQFGKTTTHIKRQLRSCDNSYDAATSINLKKRQLISSDNSDHATTHIRRQLISIWKSDIHTRKFMNSLIMMKFLCTFRNSHVIFFSVCIRAKSCSE